MEPCGCRKYFQTVLSFFLSFPPPGGTLTNDEVPKSLYQPITMFDKSRSSSIIWATPINTFFPSTLQWLKVMGEYVD